MIYGRCQLRVKRVENNPTHMNGSFPLENCDANGIIESKLNSINKKEHTHTQTMTHIAQSFQENVSNSR